MKKFILGVMVITSIFLIGCNKKSLSETISPETKTNGNQTTFEGTLKDLIKKNENLHCSFVFEDEKTKEEGVVYVQDKKLKTDANVTLTSENINMKAHILVKDGFTYARSDTKESQSAKFRYLKDDGKEEEYEEDPLDTKKVKFICQKSESEDNLFQIPTDRSFIDVTEYLKNK